MYPTAVSLTPTVRKNVSSTPQKQPAPKVAVASDESDSFAMERIIKYDAPVPKKERNYAFIDSQNLHLAIRHLGWTLDEAKFRRYLLETIGVVKAYMFIGFREEFTELYNDLQSAGFILVLKPTIKARDGTVKGNCDADLVLQAMIDIKEYDKAVIVTGDGDFASLVRYLREHGKLKCLLAPDKNRYSGLLETAAEGHIAFLSDERSRLAAKGAPPTSAHAIEPPPATPQHLNGNEEPAEPQPKPQPKKARRRGRRGGRRHRRGGQKLKAES